MSEQEASSELRRRKPLPTEAGTAPEPPVKEGGEDVPCGKTPDGTVFPIPETHDMVSSLFDPRLPKSYIDIITLSSLAFQVLLYFALPNSVARPFFLVYFLFWRSSYDVGLGYLLRRQSEERYIVKMVKKHAWFDAEKCPRARKWLESELVAKMGKGYKVDSLPIEYNTWIIFRHGVDVILLNDFVAYCFFGFSFFTHSPGHSVMYHTLRWVGGIILILFNLWVKVDAHRIVKDFAWYWGDAFFLSLQNLVFDGVFEFAPHPMYSVGYAGYYGLSLISGSEVVLLVSIIAHAAQFGFLVYFETPHIERTYGERKPLAARIANSIAVGEGQGHAHGEVSPAPETASHPLTSPSAQPAYAESTLSRRSGSFSTADAPVFDSASATRHDLDTHYFHKELIVFKNFDFFRTRDFAVLLALVYSTALFVLPSVSLRAKIACAFAHCLAWRAFHSIGLGLALKGQSESRWIVRHFIKHYHYLHEGGAVEDAFNNWKGTYNLSLTMSYFSFGALAWLCYTVPADWSAGSHLVRHVIGLLFVALHVWASLSTFEELGPFGWFYGDFFIENYPTQLYYTGIFRFLNNPERFMGGCAFFGVALVCYSRLVLFQAVVAVLGHWWFLHSVEGPHMQKLYGDAVRQDAGVTKTIRAVAARNPGVLGGVSKGVREVQGTFEKVLEETADAVEDFLKRARLSALDTRILLKQSGERFVISRVAADIADYDTSKYALRLLPSTFRPPRGHPHATSSRPRFHLGEDIRIEWRAPANHSRRDWIGVYRLGANKSELVTRVSSQGHWVGVNDKDWNGDEFGGYASDSEATAVGEHSADKKLPNDAEDSGIARFSGKKLPWATGTYEFRYHHDGKHNVMARSEPIDVFVERPLDADDVQDVRETLTAVVAQTLHYDARAIPSITSAVVDDAKGKSPVSAEAPSASSEAPLASPDDFAIYSEEEAKHIAYAITAAFDVELTPEVVLAAPNVGRLALQIIESRRLLKSSVRRGSRASELGSPRSIASPDPGSAFSLSLDEGTAAVNAVAAH